MRKNQIILIIIGVLILAGLASYFVYLQKIIKSGTGPLNEEVPDLCAKFSEIQDTVRCETARAAVLEKYLGEIKYIRRTKADLPEGILPNVTMVKKEVWLIGINLNPPMELNGEKVKNVEISVTRNDGKLMVNKMTSGEI